MTDQPTIRDQLIERAARVIHAARYAKADEPTAVDEFIAAGLAEHGLLADPEQHADAQPPTGVAEWHLAKRLSFDLMAVDLGFHSEGSEPVRHLIRCGWRPAGHTGLELEAKLDAARNNATDAERIADDLRAERDALQARIDAANAIVSRAIDEGLPADEALRMLDRVLAGETARALQGDQPTEPPGCCTACGGTGTVETGYPCEDCYATGHCHAETVNCDGTEPTGEADRG